jgi:hypothetical protein
MLTRRPDRWEIFIQEANDTRTRPLEELEALADRVLSPGTLADARLTGIVEGDVLCFPMVAAGAAVGVLGIHEGAAVTGDQRKALGAAAGLIAIAVRNVQLFLATKEPASRQPQQLLQPGLASTPWTAAAARAVHGSRCRSGVRHRSFR